MLGCCYVSGLCLTAVLSLSQLDATSGTLHLIIHKLPSIESELVGRSSRHGNIFPASHSLISTRGMLWCHTLPNSQAPCTNEMSLKKVSCANTFKEQDFPFSKFGLSHVGLPRDYAYTWTHIGRRGVVMKTFSASVAWEGRSFL